MKSSTVESLEATPEVLPGGDPDMQVWAPVVGAPLLVEAPGERQADQALPGHVARRVLSGSSALGVSVFFERGTGLLANMIAAHLGGPATFGAYSLAISTANNISTYAAGGMGATATRFSGKYPKGSSGYPTLARVLSIVSVVSAIVAAVALWFGAAPIAHILGKSSLTTLLQWAGVSAAAVVLLECARGFFVGQRCLAALFTLSITVGLGLLILLPLAAHRHSPISMIGIQGFIGIAAVLLCVLLAKPLGLRRPEPLAHVEPLGPMLREVWSFGFIQLSGLISSNLAGWWLVTLVARADTTLIQMSFFTIASQLRNVVGLAPSLLTEGSYAVMADPQHEATQTPQRVMALCSFAALSVSLIFGSVTILIVPWLLQLLYGSAYAGASLTVAVALATAVAHMGTAPAAARLTIVSIRATAVINTLWAIFVGVAATLLLFHGGSAWRAMCIYFAAHVFSSALVLITLRRRDNLPRGMLLLFTGCTLSIAALAGLSLLRSARPAEDLTITAAMAVLFMLAVGGLFWVGRRFEWLPSRQVAEALLAKGRLFLARRLRRV